MTLISGQRVVLAIHLNARGFGFVVFEGALKPVDWGVAEARAWEKGERLPARSDALLSQYKPNVVVLQDKTYRTGTDRPHRIRRLNQAIAELAERYGFPIVFLSRNDVRKCFAHLGTVTKDSIAAAIAKQVPVFERFLPPPRKPWNNEDARMGIFDAAALALTFFYTNDHSA